MLSFAFSLCSIPLFADQAPELQQDFEQAEKNSDQQELEVVEGDAFIVEIGTDDNIGYWRKRENNISYNTMMVRIFATFKGSDNINSHPILHGKEIKFCDWIPMHWLKGKKDGDILEFILYRRHRYTNHFVNGCTRGNADETPYNDEIKNHNKVRVKLRLNQQADDCKNCICSNNNFEECLKINAREWIKNKEGLIKKLKKECEEN